MDLTVSRDGSLFSVSGDTYAVKDRLKALGASWHPPTRTWKLVATADSEQDLRDLGAEVVLHEEPGRDEPVERELRDRGEPPPWPLTTQPRRVQREIFERFADDPDRLGGHGIFAGVGTGKTLTALALLKHWDARLVLVVCPLHVRAVWPKEAAKHVPGMFTFAPLRKAEPVDKHAAKVKVAIDTAKVRGERLLVVVNYAACWRGEMGDLLRGTRWDVVICDESDNIKAAGSKVSKFLARVAPRAARRLALTGTPLPQGPVDAYGQARFAVPTLFGGTFAQFRARFRPILEPVKVTAGNGMLLIKAPYQMTERLTADVGARWNRPLGKLVAPDSAEARLRLEEMGAVINGAPSPPHDRAMREFTELMRRWSVRVTREEAELDLPPEADEVTEVDLSPRAMKLYSQMRRDLCAKVGDGMVTAANAMVKTLRLLQICQGVLEDEDGERHVVDVTKRQALQEFLEEARSELPAVVFCRFTSDLDAVEDIAGWMGLAHGEVSGRRKDGLDDRAELADGLDVVAMQVQSGSGVDLTKARLGVYYGMNHSARDWEQTRGRISRPGQTRPTLFQTIVARGTVETSLWEALIEKRDVSEAILSHLRTRA